MENLSKSSKILHTNRGSGTGSRMNFSLDEIEALGWKVIKREIGKKVLLSFVNPAGKHFNSSKEVEKVLRNDREDEDIPMAMTSETADESDSDPEDPENEPPQKRLNINDEGEQDQSKEITVPMGIFVSTTSSLLQLVGDFNHYFKCPSDNGRCKGKLVVTASDKKGLGGAMNFEFKCCGCWEEGISFKSSELALDSRRQLVSLALSLAFFVSGQGYASYCKTLGKGLGLNVVTDKPFVEVIDVAFPYIKEILDEMCDDVKSQMKDVSPEQLGSWSRAVTTCDGCWQIRGYFSQNCTFVIKNYITGGLLYYGHLSMRGADSICDDELWKGTSKAEEGHLAQVLWAKAKEEGMTVEVNWQDADSSSAKSFRYSFPNVLESKIMLCGGHVGRAHGKKLQDLQTVSSFSSQMIALHKLQFPEIQSVKCCCAGKKHVFVSTRNRPACGCIGPGFIQAAKRNHYCALVHAGNDPEKYRRTMLVLGKYHSRDIHEWEGGCCSFHPLVKCSCKECDVDEHGFCPDMKCSGEQYHSSHVLKCELHRLAYEIECAHRAKDAEKVIDPELGKGHSNLPESSFSVLTKFRAKDINLHMKHYQASTNLGLLQSSMTWCFINRGPQYHWIIDLYQRMGLPIFDGIQEMCQKTNEERMKKLERKKSEEGKRKRVQHKIDRTEEQKMRKRFTKNCQIQHSYGEEEEGEEVNEEMARVLTEAAIREGVAPPLNSMGDVPPPPQGACVDLGGKKCKSCGSTTHARSNHKDCPNNKKKKNAVK